jgi:hypothetical protein
MDGMIDVTDVPMPVLVREAYRLSKPQGLGMMHFKPGDIDAVTVAQIVARDDGKNQVAISMDYVHSRAVKLTVFRENGRLWIRDEWFDHSSDDLSDLLAAIMAPTTN